MAHLSAPTHLRKPAPTRLFSSPSPSSLLLVSLARQATAAAQAETQTGQHTPSYSPPHLLLPSPIHPDSSTATGAPKLRHRCRPALPPRPRPSSARPRVRRGGGGSSARASRGPPPRARFRPDPSQVSSASGPTVGIPRVGDLWRRFVWAPRGRFLLCGFLRGLVVGGNWWASRRFSDEGRWGPGSSEPSVLWAGVIEPSAAAGGRSLPIRCWCRLDRGCPRRRLLPSRPWRRTSTVVPQFDLLVVQPETIAATLLPPAVGLPPLFKPSGHNKRAARRLCCEPVTCRCPLHKFSTEFDWFGGFCVDWFWLLNFVLKNMKCICLIRDILLAQGLESMDFSNKTISTFDASVTWEAFWIVPYLFLRLIASFDLNSLWFAD